MFGRRIGRAIQCSSQIQEQVLGYRSVFALAAEVESDAPEPKRRRLAGKFHPEHLYIDQPSEEASAPSSAGSSVPADTSSSPDQKHQIQQILDMAEKSAPRVGKSLIREGPMFNAVQALYPDKEIRVLDVSRGINRMRTLSEGPRFKTLPPHTRQQIRKIYQNLGHPDVRVLQMALRRKGWSEEEVKASGDFVCPACVEQQLPKVARPSKLKVPADFNDHLTFDGAEWRDPQGKVYSFYHFVDTATNFHVAIPYQQRTTEGLIEFFNAWLRWAGPPKSMMFDSATEANSEMFSKFLQKHTIESYVIPTDAHWQLGRAERHGAILMHMISKYHGDHPILNYHDFEHCLIQLCNAKNSMSRHEGYTPELWVLGKMRSLPGNNKDLYLDSSGFLGLDELSPEGARFQETMSKREAARVAFSRAEHSSALRKALHARSRPDRVICQPGEIVMFWKAGKGAEPGSWHGPTKVLMVEGKNLVWISHMTKLFRCAPEHVRKLSADEEHVRPGPTDVPTARA